jgi:hypothetical protein
MPFRGSGAMNSALTLSALCGAQLCPQFFQAPLLLSSFRHVD